MNNPTIDDVFRAKEALDAMPMPDNGYIYIDGEVHAYCSPDEVMTISEKRFRRREAITMRRNWAWWRGLAAHNYRVLTGGPS